MTEMKASENLGLDVQTMLSSQNVSQNALF